MHKIIKVNVAALAAVCALAAASAHAATLTLTPSSGTVAAGQTITVTLNLDTQGAAVDGVDVYYLNYNPQILQLQDAAAGTPGVQIAPGSLFAQTTSNTADTSSGKIAFSQAASGGGTYNGSGVLATATFLAVANGTSPVTFSHASGNTTDSNVASNGTDVLTGVTNGAFTVTGSQVTAPTTTPVTQPPPAGQPHANQCMINDNGTYYLIMNNQRIGIANPGLLFSYGYEFKDAVTANAADKLLPFGDLLKPGDGSLVKKPGDPTVFLVTGGTKHGFVSASVFTTLGYKFSSVLTVTGPELDAVPLGDIIKDPYARHPYGVQILQDGTVYWIGGAMKHPYTSQEVYNSWNPDNDFSQIVPANAADRAIPVGPEISSRTICKE